MGNDWNLGHDAVSLAHQQAPAAAGRHQEAEVTYYDLKKSA